MWQDETSCHSGGTTKGADSQLRRITVGSPQLTFTGSVAPTLPLPGFGPIRVNQEVVSRASCLFFLSVDLQERCWEENWGMPTEDVPVQSVSITTKPRPPHAAKFCHCLDAAPPEKDKMEFSLSVTGS